MVGRRFTVITGGAGAAVAPPGIRSWRIDLRRPGAVAPEAVAAWRALLIRSGAADPVFSDPDYLETAARHRSGARAVVFAFAWCVSNGRTTLHGVVPLVPPHPVWGNGRFAPWHPPGHAVAPALDPRCLDAVHAAVRDHLETRRRGARLDRFAPSHAAKGPALRAVPGIIPADDVLEIGGPGAPVHTRIAEPERIRDAVEAFLAVDAAHAAIPIVADPSEAAFVRVVTRLFARRGHCAVDLVRRDGRVVAAALRLGAGADAVIWRRAAEGAPTAPRVARSA